MIAPRQPVSAHSGDSGGNGHGNGEAREDRGDNGQFAPGNRPAHTFPRGHRFGKGNPLAGRVEKLRAALLKAIDPKDFVAIAKTQIRKAKQGDTESAKFLFDRVLGKATQAVALTGSDGESLVDLLQRILSARREIEERARHLRAV
ncbi:MAG: hypothetical protein WC789_09385 [Lentisphaeria bacterium]